MGKREFYFGAFIFVAMEFFYLFTSGGVKILICAVGAMVCVAAASILGKLEQ